MPYRELDEALKRDANRTRSMLRASVLISLSILLGALVFASASMIRSCAADMRAMPGRMRAQADEYARFRWPNVERRVYCRMRHSESGGQLAAMDCEIVFENNTRAFIACDENACSETIR